MLSYVLFKIVYCADKRNVMAEDEIRKHTKAAYTTLLDKEKGWQHKLNDVLVEVLIIVFAVTVSIWFHNWSDRIQEHKEEKEFLTGLQKDLQEDTANMQSSLAFYENSLQGMQYFRKVGIGDSLNKDSLNKYTSLFFSSTELEPHVSRYEALKGSGKFTIIEDKELLNNIIDLHESTITRIELLNNYYTQYIQKVASFIEEQAQLDAPGHITNAQPLLRMSQMRFLLGYGKSNIEGNVIPAHKEGIDKCTGLLKEIHAKLE